MKRDDEGERELPAEDERLIETIEAALRPAPMSAARRAAFRAKLDTRLARGASPWRWSVPALAATAAAAVALWLVRPVEREPVLQAALADSELYAFIESDAVSGELTGTPTYLPDDYRALALLIESDESER
jgi:anti-sigma-K factor RskA